MITTPRQKKLIQLGIDKGFLSVRDFILFYVSVDARKQTIRRFLDLGIISEKLNSPDFQVNLEVVKELID